MLLLNTAKYTCIGTTWIIDGGLTGGEAAGNFLIDRGDRLAEFLAKLGENTAVEGGINVVEELAVHGNSLKSMKPT